MPEFAWKVRTLREAYMGDDAEKSGWDFVLDEMTSLAGGVIDEPLRQS